MARRRLGCLRYHFFILALLSRESAATGYSDTWYGRIVADDAEHHYAVPSQHVHPAGSRMHVLDARKRLRMDKRR